MRIACFSFWVCSVSLTPSTLPASRRCYLLNLIFVRLFRLRAPILHSRLLSLASWLSLFSYLLSRASSLSGSLSTLFCRSPTPGSILPHLLFGCLPIWSLIYLSSLAFYLCSFVLPAFPTSYIQAFTSYVVPRSVIFHFVACTSHGFAQTCYVWCLASIFFSDPACVSSDPASRVMCPLASHIPYLIY